MSVAAHAQEPTPPPTPVPAPAPQPPGGPTPTRPVTSPTPNPTPQPAPTPLPEDGGGPGFFDIGGRIREAVNDSINGWIRGRVEDALNPVMRFLSESVLSTPDVTNPGRPRDLWGLSLVIANSAFVLFVMTGGILVMGAENFETSYTIKEIAPRLVAGFLAANLSLFIAGTAIDVANALSSAFLNQGVGPSDAGVSMLVGTLTAVVAAAIASNVFLAILGIVVVVLGLMLAVTYIARLCAVIVLVAFAPLCLVCHALPQTNGVARTWWRSLVGALTIQVAQSAVLVTALRVFLDSNGQRLAGLPGGGLVDMVVVITLLWVLVRIPSWIGRAVLARGGSSAVRMVQYMVVQKTVHAATAAL
jgi:hypothetical protein